MWKSSKSLLIKTAAIALLITIIPDFILALRNVSVTIPLAVKRGDNAILICNYDIENDTLYTVKWYRGRREFYRYTPKENPAWKMFSSTNGLNVDTTQSNASHVFIRNVSTAITGRYACEVSADAPSFHTSIMWGEMDVIELPVQRPIITGVHSRYRLGDVINGNCSSDYSKPAANLTWWINDIQVPPNYLRTVSIQKHNEEQLETSILEINFIVTLQHFINGRLKLKCSARILNVYHAESEKFIEEDRPRILASGRSPETFPYDHNDEFDDENGIYLTHYKNYQSSSQSNLLNLNKFDGLLFMLLPALNVVCLVLFNKTISSPLKFVHRQRTKRYLKEQFETRELQRNHNCHQSKQKYRYSHINSSSSSNNYVDDYGNDYSSESYLNNTNNDYDKNTDTATKTTILQKLPCKRSKNEIKNPPSLKCQKYVVFPMNTNPNSAETESKTIDMRHVLR